MYKFSVELPKKASWLGKRIGEEIRTEDGKDLIITNIVNVTISNTHVLIEGYGMEVNKPNNETTERDFFPAL